jgi:hypothetical protein
MRRRRNPRIPISRCCSSVGFEYSNSWAQRPNVAAPGRRDLQIDWRDRATQVSRRTAPVPPRRPAAARHRALEAFASAAALGDLPELLGDVAGEHRGPPAEPGRERQRRRERVTSRSSRSAWSGFQPRCQGVAPHLQRTWPSWRQTRSLSTQVATVPPRSHTAPTECVRQLKSLQIPQGGGNVSGCGEETFAPGSIADADAGSTVAQAGEAAVSSEWVSSVGSLCAMHAPSRLKAPTRRTRAPKSVMVFIAVLNLYCICGWLRC